MLVKKDEQLKKTPPYMGYLILKYLSNTEQSKLLIHELPNLLKAEVGYLNHRNYIFSLIFLYQTGLIDFQEPFIKKV